jgi:hypothetical protein
MASASSSRPAAPTASKPKRDWLNEIQRDAKAKPTAMVVIGPPGVGKTSLGAATRKPVFLIDNQEDGIGTLKASKLVAADIPVMPAFSTWTDAQDALEFLATGEHDFGTAVVDTIGGFERLLHEHVCREQYKGEWGEKGFSSYARGYEASLPMWREFLNRLDRLRSDRSMMIVLLAHSLVRPFKNPEGEDYDRYIADMHHKTWSVTHKWADMILFANYYVEAEKERGQSRAKGKGGQIRFFNTGHHAAYDAKNRHGLPAAIPMGESGKEAWDNLVAAIKEAKKDR